MSQPLVALRDVNLQLGGTHVLQHIDLQLHKARIPR